MAQTFAIRDKRGFLVKRVRKFDGVKGSKWPMKRTPYDAAAPNTSLFFRKYGMPNQSSSANVPSQFKGD